MLFPLSMSTQPFSRGLSLCQGVRILVVAPDDWPLHERALARAGAVVERARSAGEALARARQAEIDVLICDLGLEDLDACRLLRAVRRARPDLVGLGAIALADRRDEDEISEAMRAGFQVHAVKPVDPSDLVNLVSALGLRPSVGQSLRATL